MSSSCLGFCPRSHTPALVSVAQSKGQSVLPGYRVFLLSWKLSLQLGHQVIKINWGKRRSNISA